MHVCAHTLSCSSFVCSFMWTRDREVGISQPSRLPGADPLKWKIGYSRQQARPQKGDQHCRGEEPDWGSGKTTFEWTNLKMEIQKKKKMPGAAHSRQKSGQVSSPWRINAWEEYQRGHFSWTVLSRGEQGAWGKLKRNSNFVLSVKRTPM